MTVFSRDEISVQFGELIAARDYAVLGKIIGNTGTEEQKTVSCADHGNDGAESDEHAADASEELCCNLGGRGFVVLELACRDDAERGNVDEQVHAHDDAHPADDGLGQIFCGVLHLSGNSPPHWTSLRRRRTLRAALTPAPSPH